MIPRQAQDATRRVDAQLEARRITDAQLNSSRLSDDFLLKVIARARQLRTRSKRYPWPEAVIRAYEELSAPAYQVRP